MSTTTRRYNIPVDSETRRQLRHWAAEWDIPNLGAAMKRVIEEYNRLLEREAHNKEEQR